MSFSSLLNDYCDQLGCSNKELAARCGISASALSRYRSGNRTPTDPQVVRGLAAGIASAAARADIAGLANEHTVHERLSAALARSSSPGPAFGQRLDTLMSTLGITNADMARHANVDPSYLSRIRKGQRTPYDLDYYATSFARLAARRLAERGDATALPLPTDDQDALLDALAQRDATAAASVLRAWLLQNEEQPAGSGAEHFLGFLDDFDLNSYIKTVHYDELRVPVAPLVVPHARFYYGVKDMRKAELEFLRVTATARDVREAVLYSNLSMVEMGADTEFMRSYVLGLGALLKRGVHLSVIHDLNRPFDEMMMGLEGYIPLYMTGQISPYYLRDEVEGTFCQLINSSDVALLEAECIRGHHDDGRYYFSSRREDVAYGQRRARQLLESATPLMEIYRADNPQRLARFERAEQRRRAAGGGQEIGADIFRNLRIVAHGPDLVVVSKLNEPVIHFEIRHPLLCHAIAHMVPALVDREPLGRR